MLGESPDPRERGRYAMSDGWVSIISGALADVLGVEAEEVPPDAQLDVTEGWDSLAHAILIVRLEELIGQTIDDDVALRLDTLTAIQDYVRQLHPGE